MDWLDKLNLNEDWPFHTPLPHVYNLFIKDSNNVPWFMALFYKVNMHINYFVMFPGVIQLSINAILPAVWEGMGK